MVRLYLIFIITVLCSCHTKVTDSQLGVKINEIIPSPYENDILLVDITLTNYSQDDYYVLSKTEINATVNTSVDSSYDVTIVASPKDMRSFVPAEFTDNFPAILFSDSAYKIQDLYEGFLSKNDLIKKEVINNSRFYYLPKQDSLNLRFLMFVPSNEKSKIRNSSEFNDLIFYFAFDCRRGNGTETQKVIFRAAYDKIADYF